MARRNLLSSKGDILTFLTQRGWEIKKKKKRGRVSDYQIKVCPFCGDARWKFYVGAKRGQYQCFHCRAKGNFLELQDALGTIIQQAFEQKDFKKPQKRWIEKAHERFLKSKSAKMYFKSRGLTLQTAKHFKVGLYHSRNKKTGQKISFLVIPQELRSSPGKFGNWKGRSLPPAEKTFRRFKDARTMFFNEAALDLAGPMILTEGEIDAMSIWQGGFKNVLGSTAGADSFDPVWFDQLMGRQKIYLAFDNDTAGQRGAAEIAVRLGVDRCYRLEVPKLAGVKDWNDLLQKKPEKFKSLINKAMKNAKPFSMLDVYSLREAFAELETRDELGDLGLETPWPVFDKCAGKMQPGDLIVLSAPPKMGKTTFALNIATNLSRKYQTPCLFWCLETKPHRLLERVIASTVRVRTERIGPLERTMARAKLLNAPLYFGWNPHAVDVERMFELLAFAVRRLGIKLLVFDHLQFLIRSLDNTTAETSNASRRFKFLAEELGITIILISHPRKLKNINKPMDYYDIRDSSSVPGDADRIWLLQRQRITVESEDEDETEEYKFSPDAAIRITSRWTEGGKVKLYFKQEHLRFLQPKPNGRSRQNRRELIS